MTKHNAGIRYWIKSAAVAGLFGTTALQAPVSAEEGYYRYGSANDKTVVFSSEGDLWRQDKGADQAVRLTTHDGWEGQAHLSPDGKTIAFAAEFDDQRQVYVMPLAGGTPTQLTWQLHGVALRGWTPDGKILFTNRDVPGSSRVRELALVDPATKDVTPIPLRYASTGSFSNDGKTLFFVRHGISTVGDNARLYRGGGTAQLWRFDMAGGTEAVRLAPDFKGPIDYPMVWKNRVYFLTDESGWDNIWSMKFDGSDIKQHTTFDGWQLQDPTLNDGVITYQRGADLYQFSISRNRETKLDLDLATDNDRARDRWLQEPMSFFEAAALSNTKRVAITARGNVLISGTDKKRRVELVLPEAARARSAILDHEGDHVYLILGQDEESEIWKFKADGSDEGEQLTTDATQHRWDLTLSPDGKTLFHTDKAGRLFALDLETKENTQLLEDLSLNDNPFGVDSFSKDGRYVAISYGYGIRAKVSVIDMETKEVFDLTSEKYSSYNPTFSSDGNWLYFISERSFTPEPGSPWGDRNMGVNFDKRGQIFALALTDDATFPFAPETELDIKKKKAEEAEKEEDKDEEDTESEDADAGEDSDKPETKEIDWATAKERIYQVPVGADNYGNLKAVGDRLFVLTREGRNSSLKTLKVTNKDPKLSTFQGNVRAFDVSADGKSLLVLTGGKPNVYVVPVGAKAPQKLAESQVRTSGWKLALNPADEWQQQFLDGWRMHRDFSFDPKMRGVDWEGVRDQLLPIAARIGHRTELDDLFGQMAYPLGILHSQIVGGEVPEDGENGSLSSLGAHFGNADGGVAITHIYGHEAERPGTAGPLEKPGVDVRVGDVITHVNMRRVTHPSDVKKALINQAGEQVLLTFMRDGEPMEAIVEPVPTGANWGLRYQDWVLSNAAKAEELGGGKIGYLHLRAMGGGDVASFARDFFAQNTKDGLIIDVRDNNGGNIDSIIISQLIRKVWAFWQFEDGGKTYGNMQETFRGHLAVLANAGTYSDGDTFSAAVKTLKLGPVIGEQTAGAGIWLSGRNSLSDRGRARIAESPQYRMDGEWLIEGRGVSPDIEVVGGPHALYNGDDAQIKAAVDYLLKKIADEPIAPMVPKPLPPVGQHGVDAKPLD